MNTRWSEAEQNFIRENAHRMMDAEIAKELTRSSGRTVTLCSVRKMRQSLGIKKIAGRGRCGVINSGGNYSYNDPVPATKSHIPKLINS